MSNNPKDAAAVLKKAATEVLSNNPKVASVFVTEDGNVFLPQDYNAFCNHKRSIKLDSYTCDGEKLKQLTDEDFGRLESAVTGKAAIKAMMKAAPVVKASVQEEEDEEGVDAGTDPEPKMSGSKGVGKKK